MKVSAAVAAERERCVRCVECHLANVADNPVMIRILTRIANLIRSGAEASTPLGRIDEDSDDDG
jgi:hypothetical protein